MRAAGSLWCGLTALLLVLGCASQQGVAQEGEQAEAPPAVRPTDRAPAEDEATERARRYQARVFDRQTVGVGPSGQEEQGKPFVVVNVSLFVPEVSLFTGTSGESVRQLEVKRGAAVITVPFHLIERIHVGALQQDRLAVRVELRGIEDEAGRTLEGTIKANLELRGEFAANGLDTVVKLREARLVEIEPMRG